MPPPKPLAVPPKAVVSTPSHPQPQPLQAGETLFIGVAKRGTKHTVQWGTISTHGAVTALGQDKDVGLAVALAKLLALLSAFIRRSLATGKVSK